MVDEASNDKGKRVRNWDSCLSPLYSLETSGHNPRPTTRERTRQRLMHKFNYFPKIFDRQLLVSDVDDAFSIVQSISISAER